jgi:hypothetical protein
MTIVWPILDTKAITFGVEGVVCEEPEGHLNVYNALLLHSAMVRGLAATVLTLRGPENSRKSLRTPASTHIPAIDFPSPSSCLKKCGEKRAKK